MSIVQFIKEGYVSNANPIGYWATTSALPSDIHNDNYLFYSTIYFCMRTILRSAIIIFAEFVIPSVIIPYYYELNRSHCFLRVGRICRHTYTSNPWCTIIQCAHLQTIYLKTKARVENLVFGYFQTGSFADAGPYNQHFDIDDSVNEFG